MTNQELELKLTIADASDWEALCAVLPGGLGSVEQINSYWDHPDGRLTKEKVLLRIRLEESQAFVTVKSKSARDDSGFFRAAEHEAEVSHDEASRIVDSESGIESLSAEPLAAIDQEFHDLSAFRCWGTTRNLRRKFQLAGDLVAEVDRTDYGPGGVHYEVELESADPKRARALLEPYLVKAGITVVASTVTKSGRLQQLQGGA